MFLVNSNISSLIYEYTSETNKIGIYIIGKLISLSVSSLISTDVSYLKYKELMLMIWIIAPKKQNIQNKILKIIFIFIDKLINYCEYFLILLKPHHISNSVDTFKIYYKKKTVYEILKDINVVTYRDII